MLSQYRLVNCNDYALNMVQNLFYACSLIYRIILIFLVPITIFVKLGSFNRDYYPVSFFLFIAFLIVTTTFLTVLHRMAHKKTKTILGIRYLVTLLVAISLCAEIYLWYDNFPYHQLSSPDKIFMSFFAFFSIVTAILLIGLLRRFPE